MLDNETIIEENKKTRKIKYKNHYYIQKKLNPFFHYFLLIWFIITFLSLLVGIGIFIYYIYPHIDLIKEYYSMLKEFLVTLR